MTAKLFGVFWQKCLEIAKFLKYQVPGIPNRSLVDKSLPQTLYLYNLFRCVLPESQAPTSLYRPIRGLLIFSFLCGSQTEHQNRFVNNIIMELINMQSFLLQARIVDQGLSLIVMGIIVSIIPNCK